MTGAAWPAPDHRRRHPFASPTRVPDHWWTDAVRRRSAPPSRERAARSRRPRSARRSRGKVRRRRPSTGSTRRPGRRPGLRRRGRRSRSRSRRRRSRSGRWPGAGRRAGPAGAPSGAGRWRALRKAARVTAASPARVAGARPAGSPGTQVVTSRNLQRKAGSEGGPFGLRGRRRAATPGGPSRVTAWRGSGESAVAHQELAVDPLALRRAEEVDEVGGVLRGAEPVERRLAKHV